MVLPVLLPAGRPDWGFYGHRQINKLAVFTLPPELGQFYKAHIDFVTEHAVDPDKRRYATKHEAVRHYIDIDHWGEQPFDHLPRDLDAVVLKYGQFIAVDVQGDSLSFSRSDTIYFPAGKDHHLIDHGQYKWQPELLPVYRRHLKNQYYNDQAVVRGAALEEFFLEAPYGKLNHLIFIDEFSTYGILPYHLEAYYYQLVAAFKKKDEERILRISTEIGHYLGDACVPLHTTENYNGQLTNQIGIHAFWESRIPELFAEASFDPIIGKARYLVEPRKFFWDLVLESNQLVDDVLRIEKELSLEFPGDRQYCYTERLGRTIRTQCEEYARAYKEQMNGMVEDRWKRSVMAIGSVWYSAWLDAGSPDLRPEKWTLSEDESRLREELENAIKSGAPQGRRHDNF
jgi:hypothetical protein